MVTPSSNTVSPRNMRILGTLRPFVVCVIFRELPRASEFLLGRPQPPHPPGHYDTQISPTSNLFLTKRELSNPTASSWGRVVFAGNMVILGPITPFLAPFSFRGHPWASAVSQCRASGTKAQSSHTVFPGAIRILDALIPFLDPFRFGQIPRASCLSIYVGVSGTDTQSAGAVFPGNIRIVRAFSLFFASFCFRHLPRASVGVRCDHIFSGVWPCNPKSKRDISRK